MIDPFFYSSTTSIGRRLPLDVRRARHANKAPRARVICQDGEHRAPALRRVVWTGWVLLVAAVFALAGTQARADQDDHTVYVLNTSTGAPYATEDNDGFLDQLVREAFARIGKTADVAVYSASKRALINANEDVDQGVAMRVKNLESQYPNLIRVPEPVIDNDFVAYSRHLELETTDWSVLKPYAVTHILGWVIFERNLVEGQPVIAVREPNQMFSLLELGRADVALFERWQGLQRARDMGIQVRMHEPPLASVEMYMYVHKNHADLVDGLAAALKAMKADGAYDKIFQATLAPLAKNRVGNGVDGPSAAE